MITESEELSLYSFLILSNVFSVVFFLNYFIKSIKSQKGISFFGLYKYFFSLILSLFIFNLQDKCNLQNFISARLPMNKFNIFLLVSPISSVFFCPALWYLEYRFGQAWLIGCFLLIFALSQFFMGFHNTTGLLFSEILSGFISPFYLIIFEHIWIYNHHNNSNLCILYVYCQIMLLVKLCASTASDIFRNIMLVSDFNQSKIKSILALLLIFPLYFLMKKNKHREELKISKRKSPKINHFYFNDIINPKIIAILLFGCFHDIYTNIFVFQIPEMINYSVYHSLDLYVSFDFILWAYLAAYFNGINLATMINRNNSILSQLTIVIICTLLIEAFLFVLNLNYGTSFLRFFYILMIIGLLDGVLRPLSLIITIQSIPIDILFVSLTLIKLFSQIFSLMISYFSGKCTFVMNTYFSILSFIGMNICAICLKLINL